LYDAQVTAFVAERNRDAYATLRGFFYQIDLTISRWIELVDGEELQLESGEDIDVVGRAIGAGAVESSFDRVLSQVKHREKAITLHSSEALAAVANFVEHRVANPSLRLKFRFVTNAEAGRERPTLLPGGCSGISVWEAIRTRQVPEETLPELVRGIGALLETTEVPKGAAPAAWMRLQEIVHSETDILALIADFEWSMGAGTPAEVLEDVRNTLLQRLRAPDPTTAEVQYLRLLNRTIRVLCEPGVKRLTLKARDDLLAQPAPLAEERRQHDVLRALVRELREMVEGQGQQIRDLYDRVDAQLQRIVAVEHGPLAPDGALDLGLPPGLVQMAPRKAAVDLLGQAIAGATWTTVHGGLGSGKSELVRIFTAQKSTPHPWLRLRDCDSTTASGRLRQAARELARERTSGDLESLSRALAAYVGPDGLLILDDLPRVEAGSGLFEDMARLVDALDATGGRVVSTSTYGMNRGVRERLDERRLAVLAAPSFTDGDIRDWLRSVDAPERWSTPGACIYLATRSSRHPVLLGNAIRQLQSLAWPSVDEFERATDELPSADESTMRRLVRSVPSDDRRNLLYRLTLVIGAISLPEVRAAAAAMPSIAEPQSHVAELAGLWLQADARDRYVVSPLISRLGDTELPDDVRRSVNEKLGSCVLSRSPFGVSDVRAAWHYFTEAGLPSKAVALLTWALGAAKGAGDRQAQRVLLRLAPGAVSNNVPVGLRINLRATQISVAARLGKSAKDAEGALVALLNEPLGKDDEWSLVVAATALSTTRGPKDEVLISKVFSIALRYCRTALLPNGVAVSTVLPTPFEDLIWLQAANIQSSEGVVAWLRALEEMTAEQRQLAMQSESFANGCSGISGRLYLRENEKPLTDQNWSPVLDQLTEIEGVGEKLAIEPLWTWALRIRIIVLGENLGRTEEAIMLGTQAAPMAATAVGQFALYDITGQHLVAAGRSSEAREFLEQAQGLVLDGFEIFRVRSLLRLASIVSPEDRTKAVVIAEGALDLARRTADLPATDVVMCLAEDALARFVANGVVDAFEHWDDALSRAIEERSAEPSERWKGGLARLANVSGYLASVARTGAPPDGKDGQPYATPRVGMFLDDATHLAPFFTEMTRVLMMTHAALYAEAVGRDDRTVAWAQKGIDEATRIGDKKTLVILAITAVNPLIASDDYQGALDAAFRGATIAAQERANSSPEGGRPSGERAADDGEGWAIAISLVPSALRLAVLAQQAGGLSAAINRISSACEILARVSARPEMWRSAAELLKEAFVRRVGRARLYQESVRLGDQYGAQLRAIGYVGAATSDDASLEDVVTFQWEARRLLLGSLGPTSSAVRLFLNPFIEAFWSAATSEQRYRFRSPRLLAEEFETARSASEEERGGSMLRVIADALGVTLKP
jgi:hypothetical protein